MKKSLCMLLMLSMLISLLPGNVFASTTSTLTEILSYDFEGTNFTEFKTTLENYKTYLGFGNVPSTSYNDLTGLKKATYGINDFVWTASSLYIPLVVETTDGTTSYPGIARYTEPNKYIELEYDYQPATGSTATNQRMGVGLVASSDTTDKKLENVNYFGSLYHRYNDARYGQTYYFEATGSGGATYTQTPTMDEWHRVKIVAQLTTDTLQSGSTTKYTMPRTKCLKTYVDGVLISEKYYKSSTMSLTDEYIRAIRIHAINGRGRIDNLTVRTYQAGDAPADKGKLVAAIRNFESTYTTYKDYAQAVTLINAAKATYENASATEADVTAALTKITQAEDIVNPKPKTYMSYDFNTAEDITAFNAVASSANTTKKTDNYYGIGDYLQINSGSPFIAISPAISRKASENMYLEAEFDLLPIEPTETQITGGNITNRAAVYFSSTSDQSTPMAGVECNYNYKTTNTGCLTEAYVESNKLKSFKYGQWYRCKVVCLLNDNGSTANKTGLVKYYIDGNLVATTDYNKDYDTIDYLRIYGNYAYVGIDNLSVKTYTAENPAPNKDVLISKIREFIKSFPEYAKNADALALFNQAAAVYNNANAVPADIETALGYLAQAEKKLFNAEPLVKESFEGTPMYFFDSVAGTSYSSSATALPTGTSYADDEAYLVTTALSLPVATAVKNFTSVALGTDATTKYITAECDVKSTGNVTVKLSNSVTYTTAASDWSRIRFDIDTVSKKYDVYVNGEKKETQKAISEAALNSLTVTGAAAFTIDNVAVYGFENTADVVSDKGALVKALRTSKALLDGKTMTDDETELMTNIFDKYSVVNERPVAAKADIDAAAEKVSFYNKNLSAKMDVAKSIVIPGVGKELTDTVVNINLHHGSQLGDKSWKEIFFDGKGSTDFSDVQYYNTEKGKLDSFIESTGNYELVEDSRLANHGMFYTSKGHVVAYKGGVVQMSKDGGASWSKIGSGFSCAGVSFVDRDDNIYYYKKNDPDYGPCPLYKLPYNKSNDTYGAEKLVINTADLYGLYNNYNNIIDEDYDVTSAYMDTAVQDDDGYIYIGRYQTEWTGAAFYVSDSSGENFVLADFRPDKQHSHRISVNRNVYPNEVYIGIDDSFSQPLNYVTTDHLGYESIMAMTDAEKDAFMQLDKGIRPRSTGGREGFKSFQDGDLYPNQMLMPKNQAAETVMKHARQHTTQVPIPFGNSDYFGCFGVIEDRETAPDKFYQAANGKWYTYADKTYTDPDVVDNVTQTHKYSSNVYGLGYGEANILGGPGAYKTTDIMDPKKYYPVVKSTEGARVIMSPTEGMLLYGALTGGYSQQAQIYASYDDGETWEIIHTYGYDYSTGAGNGAFRFVTSPYTKADGTNEILMYGYGNYKPMRGIFGGDNYYALSSVKLPKLPEDGIKIFVAQDGEAKQEVTAYYYGKINETTPAIRSTKTAKGEGDALKFPLSGEGKSMVYSFDINTDKKTVIEAALTASTSHGNDDVATMTFNTQSGKVTLNSATADAAITDGSFSVKLVTDETGKCKLYIDNTFVCEEKLTYEYISLALLSFETKDAQGGDAPSVDSPVNVYYSNVKYGEYNPDQGQFAIDAVSYTDANGNAADTLAKDVTIASVKVSKVDLDISGGKLFACLYDSEDNLDSCKMVDVNGSGSYDIGLKAGRNDLTLRFIMVKDLQTLVPVILTNLIEEAVQ